MKKIRAFLSWLGEILIGHKVGDTRVIPVTRKIVTLFIFIILLSNLSSNYINLIFNREVMVRQMRELLIKDLKNMNAYSNNQYEIFKFNKDLKAALEGIVNKGIYELKNKKAIILGIRPDGTILFESSHLKKKAPRFRDRQTLRIMNKNRERGLEQGYLPVLFNNEDYLAVYMYNKNWDVYILRGEETAEFYREQRIIYRNITLIILIITLLSAIVGIYALRDILKYIRVITKSIFGMVENQSMEIINMKGAPNDEITYMGMAFNALSGSIDNLINIFRKFANKDIVIKAYRDRLVRLEGEQKELTILFSDIRSFTLITETLGTDIIKLLNMHYDRAIREILEHDGLIGAIIGDALLAVFGALDEADSRQENKSYLAVIAAYRVQKVASSLRERMRRKKEEIIKQHGALSDVEERVYRAVLLEIGVGIDGGEVFYGTIGSHLRMTNTVIGDNVNSASRLEGLTRFYQIPVICSEYVKKDIERSAPKTDLHFLELDTVQVKGKTMGQKIYWPIPQRFITEKSEQEMAGYSRALECYYRGDWRAANEMFGESKITCARIFKERTAGGVAPEGWSGIWEMETK